jgi:PAS domain S-box-containing protein
VNAPLPFFGNTADGCFVVDRRRRIVQWNDAAADLLGRSADEVAGKTCYEVMRAADEHGCVFCGPTCLIWLQTMRGRLVANRRLVVLDRDGEQRSIILCTVLMPASYPGGPYVIHYILPGQVTTVSTRPLRDAVPDETGDASNPPTLTNREREVLVLLAQGATTGQVAEGLTISRTTARNHIQHVMGKLAAHSRLEAVALAQRHGLLSSTG